MDMQNKPNVDVAAARFEIISKQIQRSIELVTDLYTPFTFSEPSPVDTPLLLNDVISNVISKFNFCEPFQQVKNEEPDAAETVHELLLLLNLSDSDHSEDQSNNQAHHSDQFEDQSNNQLHHSIQEDKKNTLISTVVGNNCSEHNDHMDVDKSPDIDPNTQITHLQIDNNNHNPTPQKNYDKQPLPFLIKHVHKITWSNQEEVCYVPVMEMFGQTFDAVMIYGIVTSLNVENGGLVQRFVIDDGSASISVVWKANNQVVELIKNVQNLDEEVKSCGKSGLSVMSENWQPNSKECRELLTSLNQIIFYIKREVTKRTKLKLFGYAAVVGKPIRPLGKGIVTLHSNHIEDDSGVDRSLELYYKKNLIRLYEEKYTNNDL